MANIRSDLDVINFNDIYDNELKPYLDQATDARLHMNCKFFAASYEKDLRQLALLHAVIDDDRDRVRRILNKHSELLLQKPNEKLIISSRYTWQKFYAEDALTMAVKRKQIEMIKILLPYYDKLTQTNEVKMAKEKALSAWTYYGTRQDAQGHEEIIIPPKYADYARSLIEVFRGKIFFQGYLSQSAKLALTSLFTILFPEKPVRLDNFIDLELFLLALFKAYDNHFNLFVNWSQRDAFSIYVIGLVQSAQMVETAKIWCEGLYDVVNKKRQISDRAQSLKLLDGESYYRTSRVSSSGLGYNHLCGWEGRLIVGGRNGLPRLLEKLYQAKVASFWNMMQQLSIQSNHRSNQKYTGFVIF